MTLHLIPPIACYQASLSQYKRCSADQQSLIPAPAAGGHAQPGLLIPAAMEMKGGGWHNAVIGPVLQCLEAATLGMPLEVSSHRQPVVQCTIGLLLDVNALHVNRASGMLQVWKTYMGRNRDARTVGAIRSIYQEAGGGFPGVSAFWAGTGPKVSKAVS